MPVFQIDIEKRLNGEFWTNRYFTEADNLPVAVGSMDVFVAAEREFHGNAVEFTKARASSVQLGDTLFFTQVLGLFGQVPLDDYLPLWNVIRVNFSILGKRPHYKLYRGCLSESNTLSGLIQPAALETVQAALEALELINTSGTGTALGTGVPESRIRMRQLRRGGKRKKTPVLPPA